MSWCHAGTNSLYLLNMPKLFLMSMGGKAVRAVTAIFIYKQVNRGDVFTNSVIQCKSQAVIILRLLLTFLEQ